MWSFQFWEKEPSRVTTFLCLRQLPGAPCLPSRPAPVPCPLLGLCSQRVTGFLQPQGAALVLSPPPPVWKAAGSPLSVRRPPVEAHTWDSGGTARSPP